MDIGLENDDFLRFDNAARATLFRRLGDDDYRGIGIAAPAHVNVGLWETLPAVVVTSITALDHWRLDLPSRALLVAVEISGSGAVYAAPALAKLEKSDQPEFGPPPAEPHAGAIYSEAELVDVRSRLAIPWRPATYDLYAIGFDLVSEPARVVLEGPDLTGPLAASPEPPLAVFTGAAPESPEAIAGELRYALRPPRSFAGWELPLFIAAPGPAVTLILLAQRRRPPLVLTFDLGGQPFLALDLRRVLPEHDAAEAICFYLASGGKLAGPTHPPAPDE